VAAFGSLKPKVAPKPKPSKEQVEEGIRRFIERANEMGTNDYVEDGDLDSIPDEALLELARRQEEDPESFSILRPETRRRMEEREEEIDKLEEKHASGKRKTAGEGKNVSFEDAIEAQAKTHGIKIRQKAQEKTPPAAATPTTRPPAKSSMSAFEMPKDNLMIYRDPEASSAPDRLAGRTPLPLSMIDKDMLPPTPEALLPDKKILDHPSIQQAISAVQKFQIKAAKQLYYETDVMEVFYKPMKARVSDTHTLRRSPKGLMCVFLVTTPVCMHCKFVRRPELEKDKNPIYSWAGYAFTLLKEEDEEGGIEDVKVPANVAQDDWI
jgi:hypothetical protein